MERCENSRSYSHAYPRSNSSGVMCRGRKTACAVSYRLQSLCSRRPSASILRNSGVAGYGVRMWNVAHSNRFSSTHSAVRSNTSFRS
jgi:hypothetical protein